MLVMAVSCALAKATSLSPLSLLSDAKPWDPTTHTTHRQTHTHQSRIVPLVALLPFVTESLGVVPVNETA